MQKFIVKENCELYTYLRNNINNMSKNNVKSLLKNKCIEVNNIIVTKYNYPLKINDTIIINKKMSKDNNINIIYEDDNIIVIDKPSKLLTIANKNEKEETLYRQVSNYLKKQNKKVFIIHRLDFDTSGIIIFAKNQKIQKLYQKNWNNLAKIREYTAVVEGITNKNGHIESYLKQNKALLVYSSKNNEGLFAITDYERLKYNDKYSLLKIHIKTGRRNQIRCHMNDIKHPIVGDTRYNAKTNPINRLALHANYLQIINPLTKEIMEFKSNIPIEFKNLVK